jgi:ribulose 1,5-bisphosphate carboxylase large subunit-like protein
MARTIKDHEELCSIRYENIERRLTGIEANIDEIHKEIDGFKNFILGLFIKSALGIFSLVCGAVFVIKM